VPPEGYWGGDGGVGGSEDDDGPLFETVLIRGVGNRDDGLWAQMKKSASYVAVQYSMHYALYSMHYALYSMHYALYSMHYALYSMHYALYSMHYALYSYTIMQELDARQAIAVEELRNMQVGMVGTVWWVQFGECSMVGTLIVSTICRWVIISAICRWVVISAICRWVITAACSFTHPLTHPSMHPSLTHPLTHPPTHPPTHPLTHSPTLSFPVSSTRSSSAISVWIPSPTSSHTQE
jgi:hypothetical protein